MLAVVALADLKPVRVSRVIALPELVAELRNHLFAQPPAAFVDRSASSVTRLRRGQAKGDSSDLHAGPGPRARRSRGRR
jgi:hypothetical protein